MQLPDPSAAYETYWKFAAARQEVYLKRVAGEPPPWTDDPVLADHRFTCTYRAADRVSQYLIRMQQEDRNLEARDQVVRTLFFKVFNKVSTWEDVRDRYGNVNAEALVGPRSGELERVLSELKDRGPIYSAAYIMPSGGGGVKHAMHLGLLAQMIRDGLPDKISRSRSLQEVYELLLGYRTVGPFLAFQWAIDLNYSVVTLHAESDFVVAGPGALDGISKCFLGTGGLTAEQVIYQMTEAQESEFGRLGIAFRSLWGRPLQPIDVQNCFCEVSKYTRVSHPDITGKSGRKQIKQKYVRDPAPLPVPFFPPKWHLNDRIRRQLAGA